MPSRGYGTCPSSSGRHRTVSLALRQHNKLKLTVKITFHRAPHKVINPAGSSSQSSICHLSAGQTTSYYQHIRRLPRLHPCRQSLVQWLKSMARTGAPCLGKRLRDRGCIASTNRQHHTASEVCGPICLDCEELLIGRKLWDEVVIDVRDRGLLDQIFVAETVAFGDPGAVLLEEVTWWCEVIFAISFVDGDGRSGSGAC